ncbi:riboflavin transporter 2-like [Diadema antillarum]|uniref:riboflavin transporter 2-like n=1 Tax=Diadema antillarum TaxID=105358 RepID=UPI003A859D26
MVFNRGDVTLSVVTTFLVVCFGTCSWTAMGGIWMELSQLISLGISEGYSIGSYVLIVSQIAVVGPIIYVICQYFAPKGCHLEIPATYVVLALGCTASFLLIFLWDETSVWVIDGNKHSTMFLILAFCMSVVESTSNLTFIPFISRLKSSYLRWYLLGEGLGLVTPSLLALAQGAGGYGNCRASYTFINETYDHLTNMTTRHNCTEWVAEWQPTRFSPRVYFAFSFVYFAAGSTAFCLLRCLPVFEDQYEPDSKEDIDQKLNPEWHCYRGCFSCAFKGKDISSKEDSYLLSEITSWMTSLDRGNRDEPAYQSRHETDQNQSQNHERELNTTSDCSSSRQEKTEKAVTKSGPDRIAQSGDSSQSERSVALSTILLLVMLTTISAADYGILPSVQSYSIGAYGSTVYLVASVLSEFSVLAASLVVVLLPRPNYLVVMLTSLGGLLAGTYCTVTARLSPSPPFQHQPFGPVLIVGAWILQGFLFSFCRATIALILRDDQRSSFLLNWFGRCTTLGAMIGSLVTFPLISVFKIFKEFEPCINLPVCVPVTQ